MSEPITITVRTEYEEQPLRLLTESGQTVLDTMRKHGLVLPALCSGMGKCGRCKVRFHGYVPLPTPTERAVLEPEALRQGYRLACMVRPVKDCVVECAFVQAPAVEIVTESRKCRSTADVTESRKCRRAADITEGVSGGKVRREIVGQDGKTAGGEAREERKSEDKTPKRGSEAIIAADIGTTTIAMQLIAVADGEVLDTYTCMNPQAVYGADVIARIQAAAEGKGEVLRALIRQVLKDGIEKMKRTEAPKLLCIACNTAMGHIFLGYDTSGLGKSPFCPVNLKTAELEWEGLRTIVLPGISAFVGGDITAGLYSCGLSVGREPWLFLDLGTNAEMIMGVSGRMAGTAAAAGSAFEGSNQDGATGTDRIAAMAQLLELGLADESGLLKEPYFSKGVEIEIGTEIGTEIETEARKKVRMTQKDIRQIQMAKAAVRTGIYFLMKKLGIGHSSQLHRIYVAGGFGFYLDMAAAKRIGLLPAGIEAEAVGNTALAGAALLGRQIAQGKDTEEILLSQAARTEVFNLAEEKDFESIYIENLNFPDVSQETDKTDGQEWRKRVK